MDEQGKFGRWWEEWGPDVKKASILSVIAVLVLATIFFPWPTLQITAMSAVTSMSLLVFIALLAITFTRRTRQGKVRMFYLLILFLSAMVVLSAVLRTQANEMARAEVEKLKKREAPAPMVSATEKPDAGKSMGKRKKEGGGQKRKEGKNVKTDKPYTSGATDHADGNSSATKTSSSQIPASPKPSYSGPTYNRDGLTIMFLPCTHTTTSTTTCPGWAMTSEPGPVNLSLEEGGAIIDNTGAPAVIYRGHIRFGNAQQADLYAGHPVNFTFSFDDPSQGTSTMLLPTLSIRWKYIYYEPHAKPNDNRDVPVL